jgi:hypothetical protein
MSATGRRLCGCRVPPEDPYNHIFSPGRALLTVSVQRSKGESSYKKNAKRKKKPRWCLRTPAFNQITTRPFL